MAKSYVIYTKESSNPNGMGFYRTLGSVQILGLASSIEKALEICRVYLSSEVIPKMELKSAETIKEEFRAYEIWHGNSVLVGRSIQEKGFIIPDHDENGHILREYEEVKLFIQVFEVNEVYY